MSKMLTYIIATHHRQNFLWTVGLDRRTIFLILVG
jgi:hypothetical protein